MKRNSYAVSNKTFDSIKLSYKFISNQKGWNIPTDIEAGSAMPFMAHHELDDSNTSITLSQLPYQ